MKYRIKGQIEGILDAGKIELLTIPFQAGDKVKIAANAKCGYPVNWDETKTGLDEVDLNEPGEETAIEGVVSCVGNVNALVTIPQAETSNIYAIADLTKVDD